MNLDQYSNTEENNLQQQISGEKTRVQGWKSIWSETHPEPQPPSREELSFRRMMGLEATALYFSSFSGLLLAAVRTGAIFLIAERRLLEMFGLTKDFAAIDFWLPIVVMVTALTAFEGYLFGVGLAKGKESEQTNISWWGIGTAFFVSAVAGIASSLPLTGTNEFSTGAAGNFYQGLTWVMVFSSGIGATLMAYLGAENIGVLYNKHTAKVQEIVRRFEEKHDSWSQDLENDYRNKGRTVVYGEEKYSQAGRNNGGGKPRTQHVQKEESDMSRVRQWLKEKGLKASQIGEGAAFEDAPATIAVAIGAEGTSVRAALSRIRAEEREQVIP